MGLDILLFRQPVGGNPNLVRESQRRRYDDPSVVDAVVEADESWRRAVFLSEAMKRLVNNCSKAIGAKKKAKEPEGTDDSLPSGVQAKVEEGVLTQEECAALNVLQLKRLSKFIQEHGVKMTKDSETYSAQRDKMLGNIGNIVHESVPVDDNEDNNAVVRTFGDINAVAAAAGGRKLLNHVDLMEKLQGLDVSQRVTSMSGGRAFVLRGSLVQLQLALVNYAMQFLVTKSYTPFYPPFFMTQDAMCDVAQLSQFDEELYKCSGEGLDKYMIATSEQPIAGYHRNKWFNEIKEPIKYAGYSTCFRKEVGSHGRDTTGIFRVHQFEKIEQFVICSPRDGQSWKCLDEMISTSEAFYKSLNIPYRVVNIVSGALNNAAAKKLDLEGYFPASQTFRELVSCSNCTDYQARQMNCRFGANQRGHSAVNLKEHPHMLNGTLCAITRTMCAICENYQTADGVAVPEVLQPFMLGKKLIPWNDVDPNL